MTLTAIVEKLSGDGNSKMTEEAQPMFATSVMDKTLLAQFVSTDGDTPVQCYVIHNMEMGVFVRQHLIHSVGNLTGDSEETDDDASDDNANTDLLQVVDAGELLRKGKFKQLTNDMHKYYTSHTTPDFRVGVGTFCAA
ncbi:hypothetical protein LSAT2_020226, partial [Lamellibrachia satsuma]